MKNIWIRLLVKMAVLIGIGFAVGIILTKAFIL
jgi:hypothetical protein